MELPKGCTCTFDEINSKGGCECGALSCTPESTGWACTMVVPFQALNMAQLLLTHKAKETQNADLLRMVAELEEFEQKLLYPESKPND